MNFLKKKNNLVVSALPADRFDLKHQNRNSNLARKTITKTVLIFLMTIVTFSCSQDDDNKPPENPTLKFIVSTLAGNGDSGDVDGTATIAQLGFPEGLAVDASGNIYVITNDKIRKITPDGTVSTFAGSFSGDIDGIGTNARFRFPSGIATDAQSNIYISDKGNDKIRKITPDGVVSTLAGGAGSGYVDGVGINAHFIELNAITVDISGNVYVVDLNRIRKITPQAVVSTLAGSIEGFADGTGADAQFDEPNGGITTDAQGNVYLPDNHRIRKITPQGEVSTFADGIGSDAQFIDLGGVTIDNSGTMYLTDANRIRKITPLGVVSTFAGSTEGFADGEVTDALFSSPLGVSVDAEGNIYITDTFNHRIRKISKE
jgi:sugar lactone lactonase YvrE